MTDRDVAFAVVLPMFNEERGAERAVRSVAEVLRDYPKARIVVIDDGSADRTGEVLERLASELSILAVATHETNRGYGAAIVTGVAVAASLDVEYALFMDSDLTNDPHDIPKFAERMARGIDVIKATRFRAGGAMDGVPIRRALVSRAGNAIASRLFRIGLSDCTNGFRAAKVALLRRVAYRERGFPVIVEELAALKALAASFAEVPVVLTNRNTNQRPSAFAYRPQVVLRYLHHCLRAAATRRLS